jgi:acetyl-CoA carboxylase carboxyl transferase subunit beta
MSWFKRSENNIQKNIPREMPEGLWTKCPSCSEVIYKTQLEESLFTCPTCSHHFRIGSKDYINLIFDDSSFVETHTNVRSANPLNFEDTKPYADRIKEADLKSKVHDALTIGHGNIKGLHTSFACMNFNYIGGSMGSVVGEKFVRAGKYAIESKSPFIMINASGGARMQEAALSLMQMAKTSVILAELAEAKLPYISILTDPTTGGVSASFAMLGDVIIAEPKALIGFAGPRVIEQTIKKKLPAGFQRSEFLLEHGFLDQIVHRKNLRDILHNYIVWFSGKTK